MNELEEYTEITGTVKRVVYLNEENGYTVLYLDVGLEKDITLVGCLPFASPGMTIEASGSWETHSAHGRQFKVESARGSLPNDENAIYSYLASGAVKGIGAATALQLLHEFGTRTLQVLAEEPEQLVKIKGISPRRAKEMSEQFRHRAGIRLLMEFLSANNIRPERAVRLYQAYGEKAREAVQANPFIIASESVGGTFAEADALALSLGLESDSPERVCAALIFEMRHNLKNGHSFLPREKLVAAVTDLIGVEADTVRECLAVLEEAEDVLTETVAGVDAVYLRTLHEAETFVASRLLAMSNRPVLSDSRAEPLVRQAEERQTLEYAALQRQALQLAATRQVMALTGGPGTGKTTVIRGILTIFEALNLRTVLCAPTGRAAQRITELSGREAYTIHRLLGAGWSREGDTVVFQKDEEDPLRCDAVILDECSMVDITLMAALLHAMPPTCRLVLVGDADQLPSVGPGCVFSDILRSQAIATVRLNEVFRQGEQSRIVTNAHAINRGECPDLAENKGDFFFLQRQDPEKLASTIVELCSQRLPKAYGYDPMDIQVLTPTRKGDTGTAALNALLQAALNPPDKSRPERAFGDTVFRQGDRVMQIRNDYEIQWLKNNQAGNGVFNGDVGRIVSVSNEMGTLTVDFDGKLTPYSFEQLHELELAYAVTVHKSQGSEYPAVVLAAGRAPAKLLSRDLLYTAVTRARSLLVTVGDRQVFQYMVDSARRNRRYSGLRARLAGEL